MANHEWAAGHVLAERYRLDVLIGSGGMGEVWRAEHIKLRSPVAIKLLPQGVADDETRSARFLREAQAAAAIRSTNVVHVLDYGVEDGVAYIAMEYLEGESLDVRLERVGRLSPSDTLRMLAQVARAIGRAHKRGIVHRDLKPGNIFIVKEDEGEVVKVLDFGIAKVTHEQGRPDDTTQTGAMLGTPFYMSPEQARGKKIDHRSDLWSLGIIAFECLTRKRPVEGATVGDLVFKICGRDMPRPSSVGPVPVRFDAWFAKATRRDPEQRFQSAKEMARALREALLDRDQTLESGVPSDSIDSFDPAEVAMLDTMAAKKLSGQPSPSLAGDTNVPSSDSWDTTDEGKTIKEPSTRRVVSSGESLRGAAALSRTAESAPSQRRRLWLVAGGGAVLVGVVVLLNLGDDETATPTEPAASSAAIDTPPPASAPVAQPSASAAPLASAPTPMTSEPAPPRPRARSQPATSAPKPSPSRAKIEFGI